MFDRDSSTSFFAGRLLFSRLDSTLRLRIARMHPERRVPVLAASVADRATDRGAPGDRRDPGPATQRTAKAVASPTPQARARVDVLAPQKPQSLAARAVGDGERRAVRWGSRRTLGQPSPTDPVVDSPEADPVLARDLARQEPGAKCDQIVPVPPRCRLAVRHAVPPKRMQLWARPNLSRVD